MPHDDLDYTIRRSSRARRVRVRVDPHAGIEVVLPARAPQREAALAIKELRPWIDRRIAEANAARERLLSPPGTVPFLGAHLRLRRDEGRTRVHRAGDELRVPATGRQEALERWYRAQARAHIAPRLDAAAEALGRPYTKLTIRNQRTRWGSCSATGALSFNWRLLLAPEAVLDYVIWHEACHLVVLDHSTRFWSLVERHVPTYREPRRWLRRNGAALVLPGPS
ncbi:MAG TPA: SprT family zinc-dependent metalloprotease [Solirubrobacteraceae bacterium]|nr:SprT family zinc-dependent metalloprotease [Solirubrobacteraceae bacterium]